MPPHRYEYTFVSHRYVMRCLCPFPDTWSNVGPDYSHSFSLPQYIYKQSRASNTGRFPLHKTQHRPTASSIPFAQCLCHHVTANLFHIPTSGGGKIMIGKHKYTTNEHWSVEWPTKRLRNCKRRLAYIRIFEYKKASSPDDVHQRGNQPIDDVEWMNAHS